MIVARTTGSGRRALAAAQEALHATAYALQAFFVQPRHGIAVRFAFAGAANCVAAADAFASIRVSVCTPLRAAVGTVNPTAKRSNTNRRPMAPLLEAGWQQSDAFASIFQRLGGQIVPTSGRQKHAQFSGLIRRLILVIVSTRLDGTGRANFCDKHSCAASTRPWHEALRSAIFAPCGRNSHVGCLWFCSRWLSPPGLRCVWSRPATWI